MRISCLIAFLSYKHLRVPGSVFIHSQRKRSEEGVTVSRTCPYARSINRYRDVKADEKESLKHGRGYNSKTRSAGTQARANFCSWPRASNFCSQSKHRSPRDKEQKHSAFLSILEVRYPRKLTNGDRPAKEERTEVGRKREPEESEPSEEGGVPR